MFQGSFKGVSRKFKGFFKSDLSGMFQGSFQGCFEGILRVFKGSFNNVLIKFQGRLRKVTWMFHESDKEN